jgi:hypothetical protein
VTLRLRDCAPPLPHDFVQVDHAPNAVTAQWSGQPFSAHELASRRLPHETPPRLGEIAMERVRCIVPTLQVAEQAVQLLQALRMQSTAHDISLQPRVSSR